MRRDIVSLGVFYFLLLACVSAFAQTAPAPVAGCASVPAWSTCDLAFELTPQENPAQTELRADAHGSWIVQHGAGSARLWQVD